MLFSAYFDIFLPCNIRHKISTYLFCSVLRINEKKMQNLLQNDWVSVKRNINK